MSARRRRRRAPGPEQGWDQADFSCGRCGARHITTTEADYLQAVGVHSHAHAVWDRLNPVERDGFTSILRIILSAPGLAAELLALADRQPAGDESPNRPRPDQGENAAPPAEERPTVITSEGH